jgi:hypothetical protein
MGFKAEHERYPRATEYTVDDLEEEYLDEYADAHYGDPSRHGHLHNGLTASQDCPLPASLLPRNRAVADAPEPAGRAPGAREAGEDEFDREDDGLDPEDEEDEEGDFHGTGRTMTGVSAKSGWSTKVHGG